MRLTFIRQKPVGGDAVTFVFEPNGPITWQAGQSIRLELPTLIGSSEHRFTISSAPFERHIAITTRPSDSDFKQALFALTPGQVIAANGLEGSFTWQESAHPLLFVAAGIGVTPFRAMLAQRIHDSLPANATLLYASREYIFADDFATWQKANSGLRVEHIADRRVVLADILVHDTPDRLIYISGPSVMVDELSAALVASGVTNARIKRDWFTGNIVNNW